MENIENAESNQAEMEQKLVAAGQKAAEQKAQKRAREVKGSHLQETLLSRARDASLALSIEEKTGFLKVSGATPGRKVYISKKGGQVDLSGFTVESTAVNQITEEEARTRHLGKVRGRIDFSKPDEDVLSAFSAALGILAQPAPAEATPDSTEAPSTEAPAAQ